MNKVIEEEIELSIKNQKLIFDLNRAIYWPKKQILIISDLHVGKGAHFRKNGIAISSSVSEGDFSRLDTLIDKYNPKSLMVLGDLSHSRMNKEWDAWLSFRMKHEILGIDLVPGNHDILPHIAYDHAKIRLTEEINFENPFAFMHEYHMVVDLDNFVFSGHVHPGVRLQGAARQGMTLPCFHINEYRCVLPAFSGFTGRYKVKPKKGDTIIAVLPKGLIKVE